MDQYAKNRCRSTQDPHLFWQCEKTYRDSIEKQSDHVMVFTGESGSGKTEQFKQSIEYLTKVGCKTEALKLTINRVYLELIYNF